jgi:hypothetical protein
MRCFVNEHGRRGTEGSFMSIAARKLLNRKAKKAVVKQWQGDNFGNTMISENQRSSKSVQKNSSCPKHMKLTYQLAQGDTASG